MRAPDDDHEDSTGSSVRTYSSQRPRVIAIVQDVVAARYLIWLLGLRDARSRYRQTALGLTWVLLQPIAVAGAFTFAFRQIGRVHTQTDPWDYFVFALAGLLAWLPFATHVTRTAQAFTNNGPLLSKVHFPRLALPASVFVSSAIDTAPPLLLLVLLLWSTGKAPASGLLVLPVVYLLLFLLASGLGLVCGSVQVRYRDAGQALVLGLQLLLFVTPVAYSTADIPVRLQPLQRLNPVAPYVEAVRACLGAGAGPTLSAFLYAVATTVVVSCAGLWAFRLLEGSFSDDS